MKLKQTETQLVKSIRQYLSVYRIFTWRQNQGGMKREDRFVPFTNITGISDIIGLLPDGRFLAIEAKVDKNKPTPDQWDFINAVRLNKGIAIVAYSLDDVIEVIDEYLNEQKKKSR